MSPNKKWFQWLCICSFLHHVSWKLWNRKISVGILSINTRLLPTATPSSWKCRWNTYSDFLIDFLAPVVATLVISIERLLHVQEERARWHILCEQTRLVHYRCQCLGLLSSRSIYHARWRLLSCAGAYFVILHASALTLWQDKIQLTLCTTS